MYEKKWRSGVDIYLQPPFILQLISSQGGNFYCTLNDQKRLAD